MKVRCNYITIGLLELDESNNRIQMSFVFVSCIFFVPYFFKFDGHVCQSWSNQCVVFNCHRSLDWCPKQSCPFMAQTVGIGCDVT